MAQLMSTCEDEDECLEAGDILQDSTLEQLIDILERENPFSLEWLEFDDPEDLHISLVSEKSCEVLKAVLIRAIKLSQNSNDATRRIHLIKLAFIYSAWVGDKGIASDAIRCMQDINANPTELYTAKTPKSKQTALHLACWMDKGEMVQFVAEQCRSHDILWTVLLDTNINNETALHYACAFHASGALTELLNAAKRGGRQLLVRLLFQPNVGGDSPLMHACYHGAFDVVKLLLCAVTEIDSQLLGDLILHSQVGGQTPLHYSCSQDAPEVVRVLLDSVAQDRKLFEEVLLKENITGDTALAEGCSEGASDAVNVLLTIAKENQLLGELILKVNVLGSTALHKACSHGDKDTVTALLGAAATDNKMLENLVLKKNNEGKTAWDVALCKNNHDTAEALMSKLPQDLVRKWTMNPI